MTGQELLMKRIALLLAFLLVLVFSSCTGSTPTDGDMSAETTEETTAETTEAVTDGETTTADGETTSGETDSGTEKETVEKMDFMETDLSPYVTLGQYKGIEVKLKQIEIDIALRVQLYNKGKYEKITAEDRTVREGDIICVDYKGILNGTAFSGGTAADQLITVYEGTGYIDGFASGFIGASVGVPSSFDVTFPENYGAADLAGKTVTFEFTVDYVVGIEDLTDALAAELSNGAYPTVDQYMIYQRNLLVQAELWEKVVTGATVKEYPEQQVEYYYRQFRAIYQSAADYYGISYEFYIEYFGISDEQIRQDAAVSVREDLVYYSILKAEGITLSDEEFDERIESYVKRYKEEFGYTEEQIEEAMPSIRDNMLYDMVQELLISWANVTVS